MKIGVIGSGNVGQTLAAGFLKHGHLAMLGTRDPGKPEVQDWVRNTKGAAAGTFEQTAKFGDAVVLCTLGRGTLDAVRQAGPANLSGKIVIDTTNPIAAAPPTQGILAFTTGPNESLGEQVQQALPESHVVKAFNSVGAGRMINPTYRQGTPTMFFCGDDAAAKQQVSEFIRMFGWEPFDCGGIIASRALEPLCILWCAPGFQRNQWTHAFKVLTE